MLKKRGQGVLADLLFVILELLLLLFSSVIIFTYINISLKDITYERTVLSKELAFLTDAVQAVPGNINIRYVYEGGDLTADFWQDDPERFYRMFVYKGKKQDIDRQNKIWYPYSINQDLELDIEDEIKPITGIFLRKIGDRFHINPSFNEELFGVSCKGDKIRVTNVLLDPGNLKDESNYITGSAELIMEITRSLLNKLSLSKDVARENLNPDSDRLRQNLLQDKITRLGSSGLIIGLRIADHDKVKVMYNADASTDTKEKSKRIACLMANEISKIAPLRLTGSSIMPIHPEDLSFGTIFPNDKIAVLIELGNRVDIRSNMGAISEQIKIAISK